MHGVVGRRHAIVDNGVDDGVIVSRDADEATVEGPAHLRSRAKSRTQKKA